MTIKNIKSIKLTKIPSSTNDKPKEQELSFTLTPKGCAIAALHEAGLATDEQKVQTFWSHFTSLMEQHGYCDPFYHED
jgi:hypothetical protein